jgi:hypothetical protein
VIDQASCHQLTSAVLHRSGNTQSYFGPVINPWSPSAKPEEAFVAGGSSGGSAAAVASDSCFGYPTLLVLRSYPDNVMWSWTFG